jgi:hypothetical protein
MDYFRSRQPYTFAAGYLSRGYPRDARNAFGNILGDACLRAVFFVVRRQLYGLSHMGVLRENILSRRGL